MGKVPDTIGKDRAKKLQEAAARKSWFDKKAVEQRKASNEQRDKRKLS